MSHSETKQHIGWARAMGWGWGWSRPTGLNGQNPTDRRPPSPPRKYLTYIR